MNILVVGAGLYGSVVARELADAGHNVHVIDSRNHIGGNCYDYVDENGIRVHKYGPHTFHTNNIKVVNWLKRFGKWEDFELKVKCQLSNGEFITFPLKKSDRERMSDEYILNTFFKPYTEKMWNIPFDSVDTSILRRIPQREDDSEGYFPNDQYEMLPVDGYTKVFESILDHQNITISLSTPFEKNMESNYDHIFNSMPIDAYYDFCYGELPYRSIKFHTVTLPLLRMLPTPIVNFTHTGPYTRMSEWKNFPNHGDSDTCTTITYEEPCDYKDNNMERYYPIKDPEGKYREMYNRYKSIETPNVTFIGRTGLYVYIDMHQAVSSALATAEKFLVDSK